MGSAEPSWAVDTVCGPQSRAKAVPDKFPLWWKPCLEAIDDLWLTTDWPLFRKSPSTAQATLVADSRGHSEKNGGVWFAFDQLANLDFGGTAQTELQSAQTAQIYDWLKTRHRGILMVGFAI